jgi:nitrite reductase (NO-forming)
MKPMIFFATAALAALTAGSAAFAADAAPTPTAVADIVRPATDLPPPITRREPAVVKVNLVTQEVVGQLADGATYGYWTFNGKLPGPMVRVRVGDTVEVTLTNPADSMNMHNVDFHAVTGPGGGAGATLAEPGETRTFSFKALQPGLYIYHCAAPMVAHHIANGMYGAILVEPAEGLPKVDREFYVVQGEIYTEEDYESKGELTTSVTKLLSEDPEFYVFNGAYKALTGARQLEAKVGETVRIYFGVGGPNKTSSFHVIGEIFDHVYNLGSLTSPPVKDVQTVTVAPGGATVVDFKLDVPGNYVLVDHALSRVERGGAGILHVTGADTPEIFRAPPNPHKDAGH